MLDVWPLTWMCAGTASTGVRYPSHLLPEVTALLQSAEQAAKLAQSQLQAHSSLQKQQQQQEKVCTPLGALKYVACRLPCCPTCHIAAMDSLDCV